MDLPLSPFMTTHILDPTHLSMSSEARCQLPTVQHNPCEMEQRDSPRGSNCDAILGGLFVCCFLLRDKYDAGIYSP